MSRVHDAMRRAGQMPEGDIAPATPVFPAPEENGRFRNGVAAVAAHPTTLNLPSLLSKLEEHPFNPAPESHLIDLHRPMETPSEEFRSLRTKLNYMQTLQSLHTVVVTSASPAEGKSLTAVNWTFFDTPPLLFSADANLIAAITDGTVLVVRIGSTTIDTITRAVQSLSENNVLGVVANGARAGELYSKYTYYYSKKEEA